jgi:DNA repair protein RadC
MIGDNVHSGHRRRIVERYLKSGAEGFADYEILEMLLFATNRYGDTNPLSKSVLKYCRNFTHLLKAKREDLLKIHGIGEKSADLLLSLQTLGNLIGHDIGILTSQNTLIPDPVRRKIIIKDEKEIAKMLVSYFHGKSDNEIVAVAIDNSNSILAFKKLFSADFHSGAVRTEIIIDFARETHASAIVLAHNHKLGMPYPTEGDCVTNKTVEKALYSLGVLYINHYVISGNSYFPIMHNVGARLYDVDPKYFADMALSLNTCEFSYENTVELLFSVYSHICKIDKPRLSSTYAEARCLESFLSLRPSTLMDKLDLKPRDAVLINIMTEMCLRSVKSRLKPGVKYSDEAICEYLRASFYGSDSEYIGVVSFDKKRKFLGFDRSPRGLVNFVALAPQLALEWVKERQAFEIYVAHNHPGGDVEPSYQDLKTMGALERMFSATGVTLSKAIIVSGKNNRLIDLNEYDLGKLK